MAKKPFKHGRFATDEDCNSPITDRATVCKFCASSRGAKTRNEPEAQKQALKSQLKEKLRWAQQLFIYGHRT
jgi:hypothetical protein